jgi:hypothetical protein
MSPFDGPGDPNSGDGENAVSMWTSVVKVLFLLCSALLAFVVIQIMKKADDGATPPGSVIVDIHWDDKIDADVDLWVLAPGDVPVGYSNKAGIIFNLLRDDLGHSGDPVSMNYEVAYGRGIWTNGEYVVNAHLYRSVDQQFPISVRAKLAVRDAQGNTRNVLTSTIDLNFVGQETTIWRFRLDEQGQLVPDSLNRIHKGLRGAWSTQHTPGQ